MTTQQPSLEAKKAYFDHFQTLPFSDDEEEEHKTGETATAESGLDPDGLDPRELRMRHRHRRFFRQKSPAPEVPAAVVATQNQASGPTFKEGAKDDDDAVQRTPADDDDVVVVSSSARATPEDKSIHPRGAIKRQRNAVDDMLEEGFTQIIGETPVNLVRKQQQRRATSVKSDAKTATPVPLAKRLMASSTSKSALSSSRASAAAAATAAKKRKKESQITLRPESEQIFKGLHFYYIPNNEIAPARRLRMQKAREYGATLTSDALQATHVIVDRDIGYKDAENVLQSQGRGAEVPEGSRLAVVVVNEDYPIECVQFRALLDARQKRYRLSGQPDEMDGNAIEKEAAQRTVAGTEATEQENSNAAVEQQEDNADEAAKGHDREGLTLKEPQRNPRKWDCVPRSTPKSSDGSGAATPAAAEVESQPIVLDGAAAPGDVTEDALSVDKGKKKEERSADASDELTTFIDLLQEFKDLPLDNDEEEETVASPTANDSEDSDSDEEHGKQQGMASAAKKKPDTSTTTTTTTTTNTTAASKDEATALADRFACSRAGGLADHAANPNSRTVEILARMQSYYERTSDPWRTMAYRKAISTLKRQPERITTHAAAVRLPGVGPRLAAKIEEIATTDRLARLEYAEQDADAADAVLKLFLGVYGVGPALARQWMARGMRTLHDVLDSAGAGAVRLTAAQRMGIARYEDLNTKIPREEVEALGQVVQAMAREVDADVELTIGGSFRRGAGESSDIDFIVSKPGTESEAQLRPFLKELVARLQEDKFLVATLAADGNIWHGCCVLPGERDVWRRIDFLLVPASQMGAALIYFTGDDVFNRSLRLLAQKKGMKLNQRGLYKQPGGGGGGGSWGEMRNVVVTEEDLIEGRDERRIFEILGVRWREPTQRWC